MKERLVDSIRGNLSAEYGKNLKNATEMEIWQSLSRSIMQILTEKWEETRETYRKGKQAFYFSAEFLVGRSLVNNIVNLGIYDEVQEAVQELGFDLNDIEEKETDPGLGNGGLGRLAACFLDSSTTLDYPVTGYGILYRYGLLKQLFEDGFQKEFPDEWMEYPYPFNVRRAEDKVMVHYQDFDVIAVPYDLPVTGFGTDNVNVLRLWRPEPAEAFDFNLFNSQRFDDAVIERNRVNDIFRVLYPNDTSYDGKVLRVRQQYFFVSASLQNIIKMYEEEHDTDYSKFADFNSIQLNDTHPVLGIPELIRILVDEKNLSWAEAIEITKNTFAFTNHTTLSEALEKWEISIFQFLFPRILEIIQRIDQDLRNELRENHFNADQIEKNSIVHDGMVHMANMAVFMSYSINGVAQIHSNILKDTTFNCYYKIWPGKFNNKTNGVTPRRWLRTSNPELSALLTELLVNENWVTDLSQLNKLLPYEDDEKIMQRLMDIKRKNKVRLADYIKKHEGITIDPDSIFDVQVKRIHEYKRQLLNAFAILDHYYYLKDNPGAKTTPVTYIFGGKSAPGYFRAKAIIKYINEIAKKVNNDPDVNQLMKVIFVQNYNVSYAEKIFPAADISEQISTVGKEASGTGNMKFMMNGALTLGTFDGANIEIVQYAGEENNFMFGSNLDDFPSTLDFYNSQWQYENIPGLKRVVDSLIDGTFDDNDTGMFRELHTSLLYGSNWDKADIYYVLGDFQDYKTRRHDAFEAYNDQEKWAKMCWQNICNSGQFSSDRTIEQYAEEIWKVKPEPIKP
ncbi:MAG: glycogen/starch/alpha-glucan phosphorylase [Saccharofermentanales bacterium]|jgi:starch phosphorylase